MEMRIKVTTHEEERKADRKYWKSLTPEQRLDIVEQLRIESGKFLYEYPARLQRVIKITGRTQR